MPNIMKNNNRVDKRLNWMISEKMLRKMLRKKMQGILGKYQLNL